MDGQFLKIFIQWKETFEGIIKAMEYNGCILKKRDFLNSTIYFDIPQNVSDEHLKAFSEAFKEFSGVTLKYKRI